MSILHKKKKKKKVVEFNMKHGTRLCCLSWHGALRQMRTHMHKFGYKAEAQIKHSYDWEALQRSNKKRSGSRRTPHSCRISFGSRSHQTHSASHVNWHGTQIMHYAGKSYSQINFYMLSPRTSYLLLHEAVILGDLSRLPSFIHA